MLRSKHIRLIGVAAAGVCTAPTIAQTGVDPDHKYAWCENVGWTNWADAPGVGVELLGSFLAGWIWGENVGWISVGDGSPAGGSAYANLAGDDFGVNIDQSDDLFGLAWGENIGWINFDTRNALGPFGQQARIDPVAHRLRGYAWGENIGWINLDHAVHFIGLRCYADCDQSTGPGVLDIFDFLCFQNSFVNADPYACDCNTSTGFGVCDIFDFLCFQNAFVGGCP